MYRIDLETLSEERLRSAVDADTYHLGKSIFENGGVEVSEISDTAAACSVLDKRSHSVQIKIVNKRLILICGCRHATRGLICEHDIAAYLGIRAYLLKRQPPPWRKQIGAVIDTLRQTPPPATRTPYGLFFSLQKNYGYGIQWRVQPYQVSQRYLPEALIQALHKGDWRPVAGQIDVDLALHAHLRPSSQTLDPGACLNCPPDVIQIANLVIDLNRASNYTYNPRISLADILDLLAARQAPLCLGASNRPLEIPLTVYNAKASVQLSLEHCPEGLQIRPQLLAAGQEIAWAGHTIEPVDDDARWALCGKTLFRPEGFAGLDLLRAFQDESQILIPHDQVDEFLEQHLLDLARQAQLSGDAITWQDVYAEAVPRLYLSEVNGEIQVHLRFGYGDLEAPFDPDYPPVSIQRLHGSAALARLHRQPEAEKAAHELAGSASFGLKRAVLPAKGGFFRLRARLHPVDFLLNNLPRLAASGFEIYGEEKLKTARVNRATPTISFHVSSGIDWFDVKAVVNFGDLEVAFKDIRAALRKREKYVKLADGSIGEIPDEWFERFRHLFTLGEADHEKLRLSRSHLTLLEMALAESHQVHADARFEEHRRKLQTLREGYRGIQPRPLPSGFQGELRPYQKAGFDWLHFLRDFSFGGCLADDMGLGKTIQTLVFLQSLYLDTPAPPAKASLLVAPRSLLVNWQREAARFTPQLKTLEYFDASRIKDLLYFDQYHLVITTYGVMLRDIQYLHGYKFHYAILDESQSIKNPLSQTARAAHLLNADHRLVLTGTPIENSTVELWSQFAFLNPGLLGSLNYFKTEFGAPIEKKSDEKTAQTLRRIVYPFILRRTKDQVAPELPPRSERTLYCDMDAAQRKLYDRTRDYYRGLVLGMLESQGINNSRMQILEGLLRLRQISNHPLLVDEKFRGTSGKFELLMETLETIRVEGHKALVFSQFVQMLHIVQRELDSARTPYTYLDGSTLNRQEQVDLFQDSPHIPFFLISLKAGGLGLNLTAADYVIHIDPWWNPAVEMQASDRTHRIGQDKPVFIYKLIARDTVEEKILLLQERKKNLVDQIITTDAGFFKNLTEEDIQGLFS